MYHYQSLAGGNVRARPTVRVVCTTLFSQYEIYAILGPVYICCNVFWTYYIELVPTKISARRSVQAMHRL